MIDKNLIKEALMKKQEKATGIKVKVTDKALEKMNAYAKMMSEVVGDVECYGYLVCSKGNKDGIATDAYLPYQSAGGAYCMVTPYEIIKTGKVLKEKGFRILGWWHSHNSYNCFHSPTDDDNIKVVLNEIASENYIEVKSQKKLLNGKIQSKIEGKKMVILDESKNVSVELEFDDKIKSNVRDATLISPIKTGFAYSVVVNANGDKPYCEVATKDYCPMYYREAPGISSGTELEVIGGGDAKFNLEEMKKEIAEKVKQGGWWDMEMPAMEEDVAYLTRSQVQAMMDNYKEQLRSQQKSRLRIIAKRYPVLEILLRMWDWWVYPEMYYAEKEERKKLFRREDDSE